MATANKKYAEIPTEQPGDEPDDVLFGSLYGVRTIELNRPKKLNSLNGSMARKIIPRLREWEKSQMANVVIITGAGSKAFCAGGDVTALANQNKTPEGQRASSDYFALEYRLDHLIATYSKPYVAIMDGITMGGGVGLSVHAPLRIATERTVYAMPETTIGFFPDVGGSFCLPRLDGEIGTYLALTSERLHGTQAFYAGIATHYLDSSALGPLTNRLAELVFKDYASLESRLKLINSTIAEFSTGLPSPDSYPAAKHGNMSGRLREAIDRCFNYDKVEDIILALQKETEASDAFLSKWAEATMKTIQMRSPTSLRVTLRQLRLGKKWGISETFVREHEMASHFMAHPDFVEGVSARLMSKPPRDPVWQPSSLDQVGTEDVDRFFRPKDGVEQLTLLEPAPGMRDVDYHDYPHAMFALPREAAIEAVVRSHGKEGSKSVVTEVLRQWDQKEGVREKVMDVLARRTTNNGGQLVWQ